MERSEIQRRRQTFGEVPELYDRARPRYPAQLFDDLLSWLGTDHPPEVVEIGCGTGQATGPLLERGCQVTAVELSPAMADYAAKKLARHGDRLRIVQSAFEESVLSGESADLVVSATAFHWVDPAIGFPKIVHVLRRGGGLALWRIAQTPDTGDASFFDAVQPLYAAAGVTRPGPLPPLAPDADPPEADAIRDSGLFERVEVRRYPADATYTTAQYLELLQTHSDLRTLPMDQREKLRAGIASVIDRQFGGAITRPGVAMLCMARPHPSAVRADPHQGGPRDGH